MVSASLIVAIDGPSGVGKSTVARQLAERLGVPYLDTGAMYRAIGLKALMEGVDPAARENMARLVSQTDLRLEQGPDGTFQVFLDGENVEERIRSEEVAAAASAVATHPEVRSRLVALQQSCAAEVGGVLEGRDIGTKVFPEAPFKFFLDALPEVRFQRRFLQLKEKGSPLSFEQVVEEVEERDFRDRTRQDSPLTCDSSYFSVDASERSAEEIVEEMHRMVRESR